jgi:carnitine O-acetyltransferase
MTTTPTAPPPADAPAEPGTFDVEETLPRVPLPTLEDSAALFLEWCAPLLTADELAVTEKSVDELLAPDSTARVLHAELERYDASPGVHSWLDDFWDSRYLGRRDRIALNANFFFLFQPTDDDQLTRAAGLIIAALDYKRQLDAEAIAPVVLRGQAMTMVQNKFLFSATRIPGDDQDTVRAPYSDEWPGPSPFRHIVVFVKGHAFRMDVIGPDGVPYAIDDLVAGLGAIQDAGATPADPATSIGRLTTKARAEWAASRRALLAHDPANAEALDTIETALFCVCLDDLDPRSAAGDGGDATLPACDHLLHGDSGNRWFDKAVSFVVFADGSSGINVEHCHLDGTTILQLVDAMLTGTAADHAAAAGATAQGAPPFAPVEAVLDDALRADVLAAGQAFTDYAEANATTTVSFQGFGSDRAKQLKMSPDAFVQMAYQLAHRRSKGLTGATYESIATRQFRHGRTEAMRVVTPEVVAFADTMDDPSASDEAKVAALRAAGAAHAARSKQSARGEAPEQHLWELLWIQKRKGASLGATAPMALFESPGWTIMRDDYLSTSSAPSVHIQYFGFGATSLKCIGVAYVLLPDRLNIYLSTPATVAAEMHTYAEELRRAIGEIDALLAADVAAGAASGTASG